ncbi:hypothetical protein [Pseudocitrobacter sp. MW920760]|uniref:hypothetical protein n=1 Tax=Pseudocitrobacter sp. MW920760 TaxID=2981140 RepID=UPI003FA77C08
MTINKQACEKLKAAAAKANDEFDPNMFVMTRDILALLNELEAAEKRIAEQREYYESVIADGSMRIASLDARTLTVKLPPRVDRSNVPFTAHTWNCCLDAVKKCLTAAGIQVIEGEGQ